MYDRVLVITINSYYSKVPSTGTAVLLRSTVPPMGISRSGDIVLAVFFGTVCFCKCLSAFRDGICDFRRPPGFSRAVDAAERNGRSGSIIEEFGKGVGGFRERVW